MAGEGDEDWEGEAAVVVFWGRVVMARPLGVGAVEERDGEGAGW